MASNEACKMFILSISPGVTKATAQVTARASTSLRNRSRCDVGQLLAVVQRQGSGPPQGVSTTAAATTGPARHPRPASSHPASTRPRTTWSINLGMSHRISEGFNMSPTRRSNAWPLAAQLKSFARARPNPADTPCRAPRRRRSAVHIASAISSASPGDTSARAPRFRKPQAGTSRWTR